MAEQLDVAEKVLFVESDLSEFNAEGHGPVSMVVSLHACDTATDEALAKGVEWKARYILSAPCCQHELQKTIGTGGGKSRAEGDFAGLLRQSILRERLCDILTDSFRAQILRILGYRTQVVEFVSPDATARNEHHAEVRIRRKARAERSDWRIPRPARRMAGNAVA
jgi:hypothetical protein